jgi:tellurite methyltransferase
VTTRSEEFFESQFRDQIRRGDFALNPFESLALPWLRGTVLDLGCGLGNLALEAGRRGMETLAVDSSPSAVARIEAVARAERLPVRALAADLGRWRIDRGYDTIVAIGLLMFLPRRDALRLLGEIRDRVFLGGRAIVNVLVEGTTYREMFDPGGFCLFGPDEVERSFEGWSILVSRRDTYPAPGGTRKEFSTVVAQRRGPP